MIEMGYSVSCSIALPVFLVDAGERVVVSVLKADGTLKQVVQDAAVPTNKQLSCRVMISGDFKELL